MIIAHRKTPRGLLFFFSNTKSPLMGSKNFSLFKPSPPPSIHSLHDNCTSSTYRLIPCAFSSKSVPKSLKLSNQPYSSHARMARPVHDVYLENPIEKRVNSPQLKPLQGNSENIGVNGSYPRPGQTNGMVWTKPLRGDSENIRLNGGSPRHGETDGMLGTKACEDINSSRQMMDNLNKVKSIREITEQELKLEPLSNELITYFAARMISAETLRRNHVMQRCQYQNNVIAFTYRRKGKLVSCKYRDKSKKFWKEADTAKVFYGLDDIEGASEIIIVEGEMDKLSMEEAGFMNCVSVPDGAPPKVSSNELPSEEQDTKYEYLWNCKEYLKEASRIILATDGDQPGQALAEELARRLGRERCLRVRWPKKKNDVHFKDANEVLMILGPHVLREVVQNAEFYPIKGLFNFRDYFSEIDAYYHHTFGYQLGISTGWKALDNLYNIVPGELTIVTGIPNSGKSEWIDALLCNLNESVGWKFVLCSMENKVREHARKLLEKHMKKPFFDVRYGESTERMSVEDLEEGKEWLNETFHLIRCEDDCLPSIDWVIGLAKAAVQRHGVNGLVIDPYNELDHQRPPNQTETEYVSQMLTKIKRFAQHHGCHVWFVAHPRQLHNWVGNPPNLYDISGSAHFINKCDNGIVIHRNKNPEPGEADQVQVCVRKVRNKVAGTIGDAFLSYNRVTGEYSDIDQPEAIAG